MPRNRDSQFFDENLKLVSFCPLCETHYNPMEAQLVSEKDDSHLLHITCKKCSNSILALVMVTQAGVSSIGLITDLNFQDVLKFRESRSIDADDVLEMHALLEDEVRMWRRLGEISYKDLT